MPTAYTPIHQTSSFNLQATLSASSAMMGQVGPVPHHPVTCGSELTYEEDGCMSCEHATAGPDDRRTRACLDHTVALLLIEIALTTL